MTSKTRKQRAIAYMIRRFKEPTTWAGVALVATAVGVKLSPEMAQSITFIGTFVAGIFAAALPEAGAESSVSAEDIKVGGSD